MQIHMNKLLRYLLFAMVVLTTIYFLYVVREILLSFILGAVLAYLLFRPVAYIESKGVGRALAILMIYLLVILISGSLFYFAIPGIVKELSELAGLIPEYASQAEDLAGRIDSISMPEKLQQIFENNINRIENFVYSGLTSFVNSIYHLLGRVFAIIFSPILAFYIMNDWEKIRDGFLNLFSPQVRRDIMVLAERIDSVLIEFIKGYLTVAAIVGVMTGIAAVIIGVRFPLLLGILSGITNLIPFFGAFLGGIPAVGIALSQSFKLAVYMTVAILLIQQLESNLITPNLIGNKLGLHPLVIVFALLSGGKLLGIMGMLIAVPITAVLKVILTWTYLRVVEQ